MGANRTHENIGTKQQHIYKIDEIRGKNNRLKTNIMLTEKQQEMIDDVMDNFDFERVSDAMHAVKWGWWSEVGIVVPIKAELRIEARRLLKDAIDKKLTISTGGFRASYLYETLKLEFVLEECESCVDD